MTKRYAVLCLLLLPFMTSIGNKAQISLNQDISTRIPNFPFPDNVYEGDQKIISGQWMTLDNQPIDNALIIASLFLNDTLFGVLNQYSFETDNAGNFSITLNHANLEPAKYFWKIQFSKIGYQDNEIIRNFQVLPHSFDFNYILESKLVQG